MTSEKDGGLSRGIYEWIQAMLCTVLTAVLVFTFGVRVIRVDGESMRETLQDGDLLVVVNSCLCGSYRAGDIVIVNRRDFRDGVPIVKRVIAAEGQTVDIDFAAGIVYVDGEALREPYIREPTWTEEGTEFPLTVPEGCLFLMGDNRNDSEDSRSSALGPVDSRCVIGRAALLALPGETEALGRREWSRIGRLSSSKNGVDQIGEIEP